MGTWTRGGCRTLKEHSVRLPLGVVDRADFASRAVGVLDPPGEADRVVAVAGLGDQLGPAVVAVAGPVHDLGQHPGSTSPTRAGLVTGPPSC
jgi:hypothetical protein